MVGDRLPARDPLLRLRPERERTAGPLRGRGLRLLDDGARRQGCAVRRAGAGAVLPLLRAGRAAPARDSRRRRTSRPRSSCRSRDPTSTSATSPTSRGRRSTRACSARVRCTSSTARSSGSSSRRCASSTDRSERSSARSSGAACSIDTIIVYASDNGFLWGEHRLGGKIWPYEESIRVPLVIRVPWRSAWGRTDTHMVLNIDFASTIAELAGVKPGLPQDGRSLVPLLRGKAPPVAPGLPGRVPRREPALQQRAAALPGGADGALAVRRVPQRLARAVRPPQRPVRAAESCA